MSEDICKEEFNSSIQVKALKIPLSQANVYQHEFADFLLNKPGIPNIDKDNEPQKRLLLLSEDFAVESLNEELRQKLASQELVTHQLNFTYDNYEASSVVSKLLPELPALPKYYTLQHIAYICLPEAFWPHRKLVGQVIKDKSQKSIVVGISWEDSEVIAGEGSLDLEVKEKSLTLRYNFLQAPLAMLFQNERERLVSKFEKGSLVCDLAGGVGHLALRAAEKDCRVIANTKEYSTLVENTLMNQLNDRVHAFCLKNIDLLDGIKNSFLQSPEGDFCKIPQKQIDHLVIDESTFDLQNLLGVFKGLHWDSLPVLHIYLKSKSPQSREEVISRIKKPWLHKVKDSDILDFHLVRENFYCLSVAMPLEVATSQEEVLESEGEVEEENLHNSMKEDIQFMKDSIRESKHMETSLFVSNLSSILSSRNARHNSELQETPVKKHKP